MVFTLGNLDIYKWDFHIYHISRSSKRAVRAVESVVLVSDGLDPRVGKVTGARLEWNTSRKVFWPSTRVLWIVLNVFTTSGYSFAL